MKPEYSELSPAARARIDARIAATGRLGELQAEQEAVAQFAVLAIQEIDDEIDRICRHSLD
jgi:uncharacterized membrane protein